MSYYWIPEQGMIESEEAVPNGIRLEVRLQRAALVILEKLHNSPNRCVSKSDLLMALGHSRHAQSRTVDVHVSKIRRSLGEYGTQHLETITSEGYIWRDENRTSAQ